ncbi:MAG: immunoglobulin domain-containing protein [Phycisphaerales bacterium]
MGKEQGGEGDDGTIFQRGDYITIRRDPTSVVAEFGGVAELVFVAPTGAGSTYQWFREGEALVDGPTPHGSLITGVNTPVLVVLSTRDEDEARYTCVAMGPCGSLMSKPAWIYVGEAPPCPGDVDGDGVVAFSDLNAVLAAYGATTGEPHYNALADFDGDGDVDFGDLNTVLALYGTTC